MVPDTVIAARIHTALADYLKRDPATITSKHSLRDDLGLDSMATIELLFRIEEAFDLQIPDEDLHRLLTVGDVITYVQGRLNPSSSVTPAKPAAARKAATSSAKRSPAKRKG